MSRKNLRINRVSVDILTAPLICPFRIAYGQHNNLENVIFSLKLADGTKGFGEAAIATHITGETLEQTVKNLNEVGSDLIGKDISDYLRLSSYLSERLDTNKSARCAIETALLDALTKEMKIPFWKFFGTKASSLVTDITIVIAEPKETEAATKQFFAKGFRKFKVKLSGDADADFERLSIVKKFAPKTEITLDANQSYSPEDMLKFSKLLDKHGIYPSMIEQPVDKKDWEGLKKVTRLSKIPICADESIASVSDVVKLILEKAAHVVNIKLMKFSFFEACQITSLAKASGTKLMIGSMVESNLSATAAAHLASGLGGFDFVDLDTPFFVKGEAAKNPCLNSRGIYDLNNVKAGIGITPAVKVK